MIIAPLTSYLWVANGEPCISSRKSLTTCHVTFAEEIAFPLTHIARFISFVVGRM